MTVSGQGSGHQIKPVERYATGADTFTVFTIHDERELAVLLTKYQILASQKALLLQEIATYKERAGYQDSIIVIVQRERDNLLTVVSNKDVVIGDLNNLIDDQKDDIKRYRRQRNAAYLLSGVLGVVLIISLL